MALSRGRTVFIAILVLMTLSAVLYFAISNNEQQRLELQNYVNKWLPDDHPFQLPAAFRGTPAAVVSSDDYINATKIDSFTNRFYPTFAPGNIFSPVSLLLALSILRMDVKTPDRPVFDSLLTTDLAKQCADHFSTSVNSHAHFVNMLCINDKHMLNATFNATYHDWLPMGRYNFSSRNAVHEVIKSLFHQHTHKEVNPMAKGVRPEASVLLYDTFFFRAAWQEPFPESGEHMHFLQSSGKMRHIRALHRVFPQAAYQEDAAGQLVELPFEPARYTFGLFFPLKKFNVKYDIQWQQLRDRIAALQRVSGLDLCFPKLRQRRWLRLSATLRRMGYITALQTAGLTQIATGAALTEVLHETTLAIWERGANYYEEVGMAVPTGNVPVTKVLRANSTFVYYVRDTMTNSFLVVGDFDG